MYVSLGILETGYVDGGWWFGIGMDLMRKMVSREFTERYLDVFL